MNAHNFPKSPSKIVFYQVVEGQGHNFLFIRGECLYLFAHLGIILSQCFFTFIKSIV